MANKSPKPVVARAPKPEHARVARQATKRDEILAAAAALFATKPFHEVRLDDIAARAMVGKGTVYLYWTSKEEVYLDIIRRGFAAVLDQVDEGLAANRGSAWDRIHAVVTALVDFAFQHPGVYRVMRSGVLTPEDPELQRVRAALSQRIEGVLRQGIRSGEISDPCPALTTQFILSFVRGAALYPPPNMTRSGLIDHMVHLLRHGLHRSSK
jgi:TetR/AcrR family fatty acid metabolism transcriptional regulator